MSASDYIPYAVGACVVFSVVRWLLSKCDNRPLASPSLYYAYSPDPAALEELARMFETIPRPYIARELDRAEGSVPLAVEALLGMSDRFRGNESCERLSQEAKEDLAIKTYAQVHNEVQHEHAGPEEPPTILTRRNWSEIDATRRQAILAERKRAMLCNARSTFLEADKEQQ